MANFGLSGARAEAIHRYGAKSKSPKTPEGKARSAPNALKQGFRAQNYVVLPDEAPMSMKKIAKRTRSRRWNPGEIGM
jgi:hypothetical protein